MHALYVYLVGLVYIVYFILCYTHFCYVNNVYVRSFWFPAPFLTRQVGWLMRSPWAAMFPLLLIPSGWAAHAQPHGFHAPLPSRHLTPPSSLPQLVVLCGCASQDWACPPSG